MGALAVTIVGAIATLIIVDAAHTLAEEADYLVISSDVSL